MPLAEAAIAGMAIGASISNCPCIAEFQFMGFSYSALDQIINHAAKFKQRTCGKITCPVIFRMPYGGKILAPEHHADTTEMYYLATPGIRVYIASTPILSKQLLIEASKSTDPVIFLEPTAMYHKQVDNEACNFHIKDGARVLRNGSDITIISYGNITYDIQNMLMSDSSNLSIEHIELFRLKPVPTEIILNSVRKTGRCLIAHDTNQEFGPSKEIANLLYSTLA